jgi:thiaminase
MGDKCWWKIDLCKLNKIIQDARQKNNSIHQILQNHFTIRLEKNSSQQDPKTLPSFTRLILDA